MAEQLVVRREVEVAAPPATVFAFLTDPDKILRWMGTEATVDPNPGGLYSFGWEGGQKVPPESSLIEIDLLDKAGGTLVRMTHSGLPDEEQRASHEKGWNHYLGRLVVAAAGGDPGPDKQL